MTNNQRNNLADLIGQVPYHQSDDPQPIYTPPTRYEIADALIAEGYRKSISQREMHMIIREAVRLHDRELLNGSDIDRIAHQACQSIIAGYGTDQHGPHED